MLKREKERGGKDGKSSRGRKQGRWEKEERKVGGGKKVQKAKDGKEEEERVSAGSGRGSEERRGEEGSVKGQGERERRSGWRKKEEHKKESPISSGDLTILHNALLILGQTKGV